jgi:capsular exopolysaccharide synthesis family protein
MDFLDYMRVVRAHWRGFAAIVVVCLAAAALFTLSQPKVYAADASGFVTSGKATDGAMASVNDSLAKSRAASYVDIASSRAVADLVIDALDLGETPSSLIGQISVEQPEDTVLIKITARAPSPIRAQQLADAWVAALAERVADLEGLVSESEDDGSGVLRIEAIEAAALPSAPVSPRPPINIAVGGLLGLLLGTAYAAVRSMVDRRLRNPELVEKEFEVSIVGRIPDSPGLRKRGGVQVHLEGGADTWQVGEAFRKLRTNLSYMSVDDPPRTIVVTSPRAQEGKSTTAINLAGAIALSGQPVTLIDGDLRRPSVADSLGLVEGAGLTDVLIGSVDVDDVLQAQSKIPGLTVLAAGSAPPNPSELLGSISMQKLLSELSVRGLVVIDGPPLLPVTDSAVLTRHTDGALVVVKHGSTLDTELRESLDQLEAVNGTVLGVIFTMVPSRGAGYGGDYRRTTAKAKPKSKPHKAKGKRAAD